MGDVMALTNQAPLSYRSRRLQYSTLLLLYCKRQDIMLDIEWRFFLHVAIDGDVDFPKEKMERITVT